MSQLRRQQKGLDELNIKVKVVAFDDDFMAKAYAEETDLQWPILLDRDRKLYSAYEMGKGNWWNIYNPVALFRYLLLFSRGAKMGKPGSDWFQLGGDILIDPTGIVQMHYVSANPLDRPSTEMIFDSVKAESLIRKSIH